MRGVTTAFLNFWGNTPSANDRLTSFVIDGSKISTQSFKRKVGTGSKRHDFVGEFLMIFSTSSSETSLKEGRLGGVHMGDMTYWPQGWRTNWPGRNKRVMPSKCYSMVPNEKIKGTNFKGTLLYDLYMQCIGYSRSYWKTTAGKALVGLWVILHAGAVKLFVTYVTLYPVESVCGSRWIIRFPTFLARILRNFRLKLNLTQILL